MHVPSRFSLRADSVWATLRLDSGSRLRYHVLGNAEEDALGLAHAQIHEHLVSLAVDLPQHPTRPNGHTQKEKRTTPTKKKEKKRAREKTREKSRRGKSTIC
eukprot:2486031-Rhodomonas_salina.1